MGLAIRLKLCIIKGVNSKTFSWARIIELIRQYYESFTANSRWGRLVIEITFKAGDPTEVAVCPQETFKPD